ncbi:MAG: Biotin synthase [Syntrophus sp. PtaB.Bin001]|nr:MAG: Biotin synthase [Syntrophus sp. PtaB.Bin001]
MPNFTKRHIVELLKETNPENIAELYRQADRVRQEQVGPTVHLRGLIEFSSFCRKDCLYCGLRRSNGRLQRYRMSLEEIFAAAENARLLGFKTVVLQSGEDSHYSLDDFCSLVARIKKELRVAVTLCIGERTREEYARLKEAGADRYLIRFETSDPDLFARMKPDSTYENRFRCLQDLRELGYQVGSGNLVGLPGQSLESLADDILKFRELELDMVGLGPFICNPDTPLYGFANSTLDMVLRMTALTRIVTENAHIPATTATGTLDETGRQQALSCGANVIMPNLTPPEYRKLYQLYPDKICLNEDPGQCKTCVTGMIAGLGRTVALDRGDSLRI